MKRYELAREIKDSAYNLGFILTDTQVDRYIKDEKPKYGCSDTNDVETLADYLSQKIAGMHWPLYGDSQEYKDKFERKMKENSKKLGFDWKDDRDA